MTVFPVLVATTVLLALLLLAAAGGVARRTTDAMQLLDRIGASRLAPVVIVADLAGAVGLLVGLVIEPIGIAAAAGVLAYLLVAVGFHLRAGDRNLTAAAIGTTLAVATLVLRVVTT